MKLMPIGRKGSWEEGMFSALFTKLSVHTIGRSDNIDDLIYPLIGDCLVGRTVAQLKFDADEFDVLPCHFGPLTLGYLESFGWNNILHGYSHYPESFQRVIHFLLPCLVYQ